MLKDFIKDVLLYVVLIVTLLGYMFTLPNDSCCAQSHDATYKSEQAMERLVRAAERQAEALEAILKELKSKDRSPRAR